MRNNNTLMQLMRFYQYAVVAAGMLLPAGGIAFIMLTGDYGRRFALHGFHEIAITVAVSMSAFIAVVAYGSYQRDKSAFVRFVALAYLGFAIVYMPHGVLTSMADHNMMLFVIFGPVSRLIMSAYLFAGLFHLSKSQTRQRNGEPSWWPHILFFIVVAAILYFVLSQNIGAKPIHIKMIESVALFISCLALLRMWLLPYRSPLMWFHIVAQCFFVQASLAFILSIPWNALWWFAHAVSAAGFIVLGYAVTRIYLGTRSLATVYDTITLHNILDKIVEHSPVGILVVDNKLNIVRRNHMIEEMLGHSDGKTDLARLLFSHFHIDETALDQALRESSVITHRFEMKRSEYTSYYEARIARLHDGKASGFICILIDISEARKAEEAIRNLNASLEREVIERTAANKELESFCYSVSHDLRSPLRAMEGFSRLIEEDHASGLDDEGKRYLSSVRDSSRRMGQLIDDLLAFSRLGRAPLQTSYINMESLVKDVLNDLNGHNAAARFDIKVKDIPSGHGDAAPLKQVWTNLLSNALKFSAKAEHPMVEVSGSTNDTENIYCVKDNGAGFNMKYYDKLFGVFQRLHGQNEFEGTGVGLAIVQRVVTRHGGRVWAESEEGSGAAFYFSLPKPR